ncbi:hypothetical protein [Candidatus Uabimicrobium amorphum]|uniref:Peptidase S74 domain-containing protein n=1 Tax=Uabimicrobium amorphum TaxID=2596890 RepID=A0A5S9ISH0_UABAM|nr:hypothetical protein [Candidatus Uabimicrobium amorphum]BBM86330.1 hypothetical protein UABAM_04716 [Candidatus Uabimicrobium amorphum]
MNYLKTFFLILVFVSFGFAEDDKNVAINEMNTRISKLEGQLEKVQKQSDILNSQFLPLSKYRFLRVSVFGGDYKLTIDTRGKFAHVNCVQGKILEQDDRSFKIEKTSGWSHVDFIVEVKIFDKVISVYARNDQPREIILRDHLNQILNKNRDNKVRIGGTHRIYSIKTQTAENLLLEEQLENQQSKSNLLQKQIDILNSQFLPLSKYRFLRVSVFGGDYKLIIDSRGKFAHVNCVQGKILEQDDGRFKIQKTNGWTHVDFIVEVKIFDKVISVYAINDQPREIILRDHLNQILNKNRDNKARIAIQRIYSIKTQTDSLDVDGTTKSNGDSEIGGNLTVSDTYLPKDVLELSAKNIEMNNKGISTKGRDVYFHSDSADFAHGIGMYHDTKKFANVNVNGPVVYGYYGGALGSTEGGQKIALRWDSNGDVKVTGQLSAKKISGAEDLSIGKVNANIISLNGGGTIKRVFDNGNYSLEISSTNLYINNKGISTKGRDVYFHSSITDFNHGIGLYHAAYSDGNKNYPAKLFAGENVNGPVVYGYYGGALGSNTNKIQKIALHWDSAQNVSVKGNLTTNKTLNANHISTKSVNVTEKFDAKSLHIDKDGWIGMNTAPVKDFTLAVNGRIGIGVTKLADAATKLAVKGKITAEEVRIVKMDNWADFVFADDYKLIPIDQLEQSIKRNKHLPNIPSEREVKEQGIQLGEMQAKLLQKIEELTLYTIQQEKKITTLQQQKNTLENKVAKMKQNEQKINALQKQLVNMQQNEQKINALQKQLDLVLKIMRNK